MICLFLLLWQKKWNFTKIRAGVGVTLSPSFRALRFAPCASRLGLLALGDQSSEPRCAPIRTAGSTCLVSLGLSSWNGMYGVGWPVRLPFLSACPSFVLSCVGLLSVMYYLVVLWSLPLLCLPVLYVPGTSYCLVAVCMSASIACSCRSLRLLVSHHIYRHFLFLCKIVPSRLHEYAFFFYRRGSNISHRNIFYAW